MARNKSGLEQIAKILILIDGILILVGAIIALLNLIGQSISDPIPDLPGSNGFGAGAVSLSAVVSIIIAIIIAIIYIMHFTGRVDMGEPLMNGILFLVLGLIFGGLLTIIGGILYIIAALV